MRVSSRLLHYHLIQSLSFTLFERFLVVEVFFGHFVSLIGSVRRVGVLSTVPTQVSGFLLFFSLL